MATRVFKNNCQIIELCKGKIRIYERVTWKLMCRKHMLDSSKRNYGEGNASILCPHNKYWYCMFWKHRTVVRKFIENTQTNDLHVATLCHGYHGISIYNLKQGGQVSNLIVDNLEYVLQFPVFLVFSMS